ncbi:hypothetical protein DVH05_026868 [Phytophthora capsici]|nr:hypothetical protein DVH05_026868 [Phytophthora capsici]
MRALCFIFSVLLLLLEIDASSVFNAGAAVTHPHLELTRVTTPTRLLRTSHEEENDERAGASVLDDIVAKAMQLINKNPEDVFKKLKLANTNLQNNAVFEQWLQYVYKFRAANGEDKFTDQRLFNLLRKSQNHPDDLVPLFQSLTHVQGMKDLARTMQLKLFESGYQSTRNLMNKAWLQGLDTPDDVFHILLLEKNALESQQRLPQWLKFAEMYKTQNKISSWKNELNLLLKTPHEKETEFGLLFQSLKKTEGIETIAAKMEAQLFNRWIKTDTMTPDKVGVMLASPTNTNWKRIFEFLPVTEPRHVLLESYTVAYAASRGGKVLKSVEKLFANNQPVAALERAIKV